METVVKFVLSLVVQAALYSMVVMLYNEILQRGIANLSLSRVATMFVRVVGMVTGTLYKALLAPIKVLFQVLRQVLQIPITLAWQNVPGVSDIAAEPQVGSLLPGLSLY